MSIIDSLVGPIASIIDKIIPDPKARERAKLELLQLEGSQELATIQARLSAIVIAKNEAAKIGDCLDSLAFCDERIVVDSGSSDDTVALAEVASVVIVDATADPPSTILTSDVTR